MKKKLPMILPSAECKKYQKYAIVNFSYTPPFPNGIPQPDIPHIPPPPEVNVPYGKLALLVGGAAGVNLGIAFYARSRRTKKGKVVVERVRRKR